MSAPNPPVPYFIGETFVETRESGTVTREVKDHFEQVFEGTYDACFNLILGYPRGYQSSFAVKDSSYILWTVSNSEIKPVERGGKARATIRWEAAFLLPPDEIRADVIELNPKIERHPNYQPLWDADVDGSVAQAVRAAVDAVNNGQMATAKGTLAKNPILADDPGLSALAANLLQKIQRGQESFYLAGFKWTWANYYNYGYEPRLNAGGFTDITPSGPAGFPTANVLPSNLSWLRQADNLTNTGPLGTIIRVERTWIGGPNGYWDPDLYPANS